MIEVLKSNKLIIGILALALFLRVLALYIYGLDLTLNSDDVGYTRSARVLLETGMLMYHQVGEPTVHIMPGQSVLLAGVFAIFGSDTIGLYAARIVITFFGLISILFVYLIAKYIFNKWTGIFAAFLLAIFVPQIVTDNLLLTESPYMAGFYIMVYFSLRLPYEKKMSHFYFVILAYLFCVMFRPTIALYPIVLLVYLLIKKYPYKLMIKQFLIALGILLLVLGPWWIRNYIHYHEFIPLSGGTGNPSLLGTYQGDGYRYGDSYDNVLKEIQDENPGINAYEYMEIQKEYAIERIKSWFDQNPLSFIKSYTIDKTIHQWISEFYWVEIFNFSNDLIQKIHKLIMLVGFISLIIVPFIFRKRFLMYAFLVALLAYFTLLNNAFFAFDRYNQPLMAIWFIFIGAVLSNLFHRIKKRRRTSPLSE